MYMMESRFIGGRREMIQLFMKIEDQSQANDKHYHMVLYRVSHLWWKSTKSLKTTEIPQANDKHHHVMLYTISYWWKKVAIP